MTLNPEQIKERYRRKDLDRTKRMLILRARGFTLEKIAGLFKLKSRERVRQIIESSQNEPELQDLYLETIKTRKFLDRNLKGLN